MFTGIVEAVGELLGREPRGGDARLAFSHPGWEEGLEIGASVAVDGCCLTVVERDRASFQVEATRQTLALTRFGDMTAGAAVNLERPLAVGDRLGGHWVQGHVDGLGTVKRISRAGETGWLEVDLPSGAGSLVVPRGSIALNGVSLTVQDVDDTAVRTAVIPHTWANTNLSSLASGAWVHVEYDILAKYVAAALRHHGEARA